MALVPQVAQRPRTPEVRMTLPFAINDSGRSFPWSLALILRLLLWGTVSSTEVRAV